MSTTTNRRNLLAGAAARAALANAPRDMAGHWEADDDYTWLALLAAEALGSAKA